MFKYVLEGHYRGFIAHDRLVTRFPEKPLVCDTVVIPLHNSCFLIFRHRLPEIGATFSLVVPNNAPFRVINSEYVHEPVPNLEACRTGQQKSSTVLMMSYFTIPNFNLDYPNFPTDFKLIPKAVMRISFNGQSHFFDLTERDCEKLRWALNYKPRQPWRNLYCRNIEMLPTEREITMPFYWTVIWEQKYF